MYTHTNVHKNNNKNIIQKYMWSHIHSIYKNTKKQKTDQLSFNCTFYIQSKENIASNIAPYFYMYVMCTKVCILPTKVPSK